MEILENNLVTNIAIIGGGNMGMAFARGLLNTNQYNIVIADPNLNALAPAETTSLVQTRSNLEAVKNADVIIIAVKPQIIGQVLEEIRGRFKEDVLIISIVAGISLKQLGTLGSIAVVRAMPNLCAQISKSVSVWVKNTKVTLSHELTTKQILSTIGVECELQQEKDINSATAISGSGPAYVFYLAESMIAEAERLGLSKEISKILVQETISGCAGILKQSQSTAFQLRVAVTSKGGTTEAAFNQFEQMNLGQALAKGIQAAAKRAHELGEDRQ